MNNLTKVDAKPHQSWRSAPLMKRGAERRLHLAQCACLSRQQAHLRVTDAMVSAFAPWITLHASRSASQLLACLQAQRETSLSFLKAFPCDNAGAQHVCMCAYGMQDRRGAEGLLALMAFVHTECAYMHGLCAYGMQERCRGPPSSDSLPTRSSFRSSENSAKLLKQELQLGRGGQRPALVRGFLSGDASQQCETMAMNSSSQSHPLLHVVSAYRKCIPAMKYIPAM
eukprot:1160756-Pelagomonas_calceolata.AAC.11